MEERQEFHVKKVTMFILPSCPYCIRALKRIEKVMDANPELRAVPFETVDERRRPDLACAHDYYFVPSFYVDGRKVYEEGVLHADLEEIFREALGS